MPASIAFACDHRGFQVKSRILDYLKRKGYSVIDCGTDSPDSVDYPDFILKAAELVRKGKCERAIGVCYTGIGSTIVANKVRGVRAALVQDVKQAALSRGHNNANMLILGAGFIPEDQIAPILETWLETPFEGGRHQQRVDKISRYEQNSGGAAK